MTKAQIKAKLRRSACEDEEPVYQVHSQAFKNACGWIDGEWWPVYYIRHDHMRNFFLLVAEAL